MLRIDYWAVLVVAPSDSGTDFPARLKSPLVLSSAASHLLSLLARGHVVDRRIGSDMQGRTPATWRICLAPHNGLQQVRSRVLDLRRVALDHHNEGPLFQSTLPCGSPNLKRTRS